LGWIRQVKIRHYKIPPSENESTEEEALIQLNRLKRAEVQEVINNLNPNKLSCYNLITGNILKE
jgi:hypothetical protein